MKKPMLVLFCTVFCAIGGTIAAAFPLSYVASSIGRACMCLGMVGVLGAALWGRKGFTIGYMVGGLYGALWGAFDLWPPDSGGLVEAAYGALSGLTVGLMFSLSFLFLTKKFYR